MRFKKMLSAILAAAITASSLSVVSSAKAPETPQTVEETVEKTYQASGDSFVSGDFKYTELEDGTLEVTCNNKKITKAVIPSTVKGKKVTSIGYNAFYYCTSLTSVTIPTSVTSISSWAFEDCTSLTSVTIPSSVKSIGNYAFFYCTGLTSVTISNGVTSIGYNAFYNCKSLKSVTIPQSVTNIGSQAFESCTGLTAINVNANNKTYCSVSGVLYNKDKTMLVKYPMGKTAESYSIPNSVTSIGDYAFDKCTSLKSVTIPTSVKSIGSSAFCNCANLTSATIPNSVTNIGYEAFRNCTSLKSITIPQSVIGIGSRAFTNCKSVTAINVNANNKAYCSVNGVLFNKDKSTLIQYPIGKTTKSYTIPNSVTSIGTSAFYSCTNLTSLTIPNSVTSINDYACYGCTGLTSLTIPNSVKYIDWYAFEGCTSLKSVTIPKSVTSIGSGAFHDCTSLTSVTIPNSVTEIGGSVFSGCRNLKSITLPNSITSMGSYVFDGCTSLTSVTIPNSITSIGSGTFYGCTSLKSITIPTGVTEIGNYSFYKCTGLTSVKIPSNVKSIGNSAFESCTNLKSITIPNSVTSIGSWCFNNSGLKVVYYTGTKAQWDKIQISGTGNTLLKNATINYSSIPRLTGLNATTTASTVKLTWDKDPEASYYKVWTWKSGKLTQLTQTTSNATVTYTASKLVGNTSYKYRVTAYNKSGKVVAYNDITAKTKYGTISGLKAAPSNSSVKLTWTKNTAASYYKVFIWKDSKWTQLTQTKSNATVAHTISKLAANTSYKFRVTAYNSGNKAIAYSDITSKTYGKTANLKAAPTSSSVKLTWSKNTSASYYKVFIWKNSKWTQLTQTTSNATVAYTASKLTANTSYKFRVTGYNSSGKAIAYSDITAKTKYGTIASLKAAPAKNSVKLTWTKNASAGYYKVFIWKNSQWTQLTQTTSNATVAYTASKLTASTSYKFRVTAYTSSGKAIAYSDVTAKTTA